MIKRKEVKVSLPSATSLEIFSYESSEVRVQIINGEPWWCASDACNILDYANPSKATTDHCRVDGITKCYVVNSIGKNQEVTFINEPNLYRLISRCNLPSAEKFERWVFEEVLPQIRKTGAYSTKVPKTFAEALRLAADFEEQLQEKQQQLLVQQPKVEYFEKAYETKDVQTMSQVAKSIGVKFKIGRNKLFEILRKKKILRENNEPYQEFVDRGFFKTVDILKGTKLYPTTFVTVKGKVFIFDSLSR